MPWLITHTLDALNTEHIHRIYAAKAKVKATLAGIPVDVAVDLDPNVARRVTRDIIDELALGHSVEVVGGDVRRLSQLR